jgi:hypothetical protein
MGKQREEREYSCTAQAAQTCSEWRTCNPDKARDKCGYLGVIRPIIFSPELGIDIARLSRRETTRARSEYAPQ